MVAFVVAALALAVCAASFAAHPKAGRRYAGATSVPKIEGFSAPVSFTVSANAKKLLRFTYGSFGCQGAGGFKPGVNPYTKHSLVPVGSISVTGHGGFKITNAKFKYSTTGGVPFTVVTSSSVTGRFTSSSRASGTIRFSQTYIPKHSASFTCHSNTLTFMAKG